jgi:hypothetical protein
VNLNIGPAATTTSFAVPIALNPNDFYSIGVVVKDTVNGGTSRSDLWTVPFIPTTSGPPVFLPTLVQTPGVGSGFTYKFDVGITAGQPIGIDPLAAIGFIYQIGAGDPNFA